MLGLRHLEIDGIWEEPGIYYVRPVEFVGEERTHKDAMKTVIALNFNPNVVSRLQIVKGFNS